MHTACPACQPFFKHYPNAAHRMPKGCPKAAQRFPKSCPKAAPNVVKHINGLAQTAKFDAAPKLILIESCNCFGQHNPIIDDGFNNVLLIEMIKAFRAHLGQRIYYVGKYFWGATLPIYIF